MHHFTISTLSNPESHTNFSFQKCQPVPKVARRILYKPTRIHYTRANVRKKMECLEQENQAIHAEVIAAKAKIEELI